MEPVLRAITLIHINLFRNIFKDTLQQFYQYMPIHNNMIFYIFPKT